MIIFGTVPRVIKDKNIKCGYECPKCSSTNTYSVMIGITPHIFLIPLTIFSSDEGPGIICKDCKSKFDVKGELGGIIEKIYNENDSQTKL